MSLTYFDKSFISCQTMTSTLNHTLTRSRWRVSTSARRTSLLCRWRWSWPAAGRKHMSSCRENSPALCHSSQTSFCYHRNQGLNPGCLLRWCTLMEGKRSRENDEEDEKTRRKRGGNIRCEVYLVWECWRFPEGWMGCGGGKPWLHYPPDLQLEQSERKEKEKQKQKTEVRTRLANLLMMMCVWTWCVRVYLVWCREGDLFFHLHSLCCKKRAGFHRQ